MALPDLPKIYGDYETMSGVDITERGRMNYLHDPQADIVFLAYREGIDGETKIWFPGDDLLPFMTHPEKYIHYYFNIQFDAAVQEILGAKYGMRPIPLDNQVDVMGLCGRYTFPQSLEKAAIATGSPILKTAGKALIKKITQPPFKFTDTDFRNFIDYGINDVDTMCEIVKRLPLDYLSERETKVWQSTVRINRYGTPIDVEAMETIMECVGEYKAAGLRRLKEITRGEIDSVNQHARIKKFLDVHCNLKLPNTQAETIEKILEREDILDLAREILELRRDLGPAAVNKFTKALATNHKGRVHDILRYYGGHTGRWGGMGFQIQNLPRAKSKAPDKLLAKFYDKSIMQEQVVLEAKKLVRHCIKAAPGRTLSVLDYTGIENRFLAWFTDDHKTLKLFAEGGDQYKDMASFLHKVKYEEVDDTQRFHGKVIILGCGYGMGADKFKAQVAGYGLKLTDAEAAKYVSAYRAKYPEVPKMWYACYNAAVAAIRHSGSTFMQYKCRFRVIADKHRSYMVLTLPNGNTSFYINPRLENPSSYRPTILYEGINGYTKKWDKRKKIIPGLLTENIIQFAAREFLCDDLLVLHEKNYDIVGLIHDEIPDEPLLEVAEARHAEMKKIMSTSSEWCKELPMGADGYIHTNYRKD